MQSNDERPGIPAWDDLDYRAQDADFRRYWETGANPAITSKQRRVLRRWCYRAKGPATAHLEIVRAIAEFVHIAMPRGDSERTESPPRPLGWIIDSGVGEAGEVAPPDTIDSPGWVCINTVTLSAAMLRELGYPVRECNVYLSQAGALDTGFRGAIYQQAAMQVWFDGAWHWVDPYFPAYDAAVTRDDRSRYKVDVPCYWAGTTPPISWRPALPESDWRPFELEESTGPTIQRRFYPKRTDERGQEIMSGADAGARVFRAGSESDRRGGTTTSGVFIRTTAWGVRLSLQDEHARVTSCDRSDIPGALHIPRGTPIFGLDPRISVDRAPRVLVDGQGFRHMETVFFGTRSLLASWDEVGAHELTLVIEGPIGSRVDLQPDVTIGDHVVTVNRLAKSIIIDDSPMEVRFQVVIDPLDAGFHALFALLLRDGIVTEKMYWPATDAIRAVQERARVAAVEVVKESTPPPAQADAAKRVCASSLSVNGSDVERTNSAGPADSDSDDPRWVRAAQVSESESPIDGAVYSRYEHEGDQLRLDS